MSLDRVFVIGAGLMGHGIAQVSAAAGKVVTLADRTAELAEKGKARVAGNLARSVEKGRLAQEEADGILARISTGIGAERAAGHGRGKAGDARFFASLRMTARCFPPAADRRFAQHDGKRPEVERSASRLYSRTRIMAVRV